MKICHIQLFSILSGAQRVSLEEFQANNWDKNKYEYHLICRDEGDFSLEALKLGVTVHYVPNFRREISLVNDIISLWRIFKILRAKRFDVVHTHSSKPGLLGRIAAYIAKTPRIVHTVHGFGFQATKSQLIKWGLFQFEKYLGKFITDSLIVMNHEDEKFANEKLSVPNEKIHLIYNSRRFKTVPSKYKLEIKDSIIKILFLGRLCEQKDPYLAIETFRYLNERHSNLELDIIGEGDLKEELLEYVSNLNLDNKIKFHGWKNDIIDLLDKSHVFLGTSKWEGFPLAVIEASSRGCIPYMRDSSGYREIYYTFKIGSLNQDDDYFKNIEKLLFNILNKEIYREILEKQNENLEKIPTQQQRFKDLINIYEQTIS